MVRLKFSMGKVIKRPINMHIIDRVSRITTGLFIMSLAFWGPKKLYFLAGYIPIISGFTGHCFIYRKFGFSSLDIFNRRSYSQNRDKVS